jgi:hypothetical protein
MIRQALFSCTAAFALMSLPAFAQTAAPASAEQAQAGSSDIVVTARSLQETADALAACLARNCPPDEDVRATLAHAENQFVTGNYRDARGTMLSSLRRNREHRGEFPIEVSDLMRANSRVAAHLGEADAYQTAVLDMRDTLRNALPANDPRVLAAQVEVADSRARLGYPREARDMYGDIAEQATTLNLPRIAAFAKIRRAMLDLPRDRADRVTSRVTAAIADLTDIAGKADTVGSDLALLAEVALARIEREDGNLTRTEALMRRFSSGEGARRPLLISSEPVRLSDADAGNNEASTSTRLAGVAADNRWIDVGFWVNSDGAISDYEVLRRSPGGDGPWVDAVQRSVASRRYAPLRATGGIPSQGFYIVERYTLTADFQDADTCTGSRLRCRSSRMRVERIDLTPDDLAVTPPAATAG